MQHRILVAYGTKYGATAEIAERIAAVLRDHGLDVHVTPADRAGDVSTYTAVVLGSAVYAGSWRKEAADFLSGNEPTLASRPLWLFSSGPTGEGDPVELMKGWEFPEAQQPIADRVHPQDIRFFHGAIDLKKLNFAEKLLVKGIKAPIGDFRRWDDITAWAAEIARVLQTEPVLTMPA